MNAYRPVIFAITFAAMILGSCGTMVPIEMVKPAEINMAGSRRIAVLEFGYPDGSSILPTFDELWNAAVSRLLGVDIPGEPTIEEELAGYVTDRLIETLVGTDYFEVVNPAEVVRVVKGHANKYPSPIEIGRLVDAQAILIGEITEIKTDETTYERKETRTNDEGESVTIRVTYYRRRLSIGLAYSVIDTKTGATIAKKRFEDEVETEVPYRDRKTLEPEETVYESMIDRFLPAIAKQLAPYRVVEYRALAPDQTKNPDMKQAEKLVQKELYEDALAVYLGVWKTDVNPAAGINGAIMYEALGDLDAAIGLIRSVADATGHERALDEYARLRTVAREREQVENQMR